MIFIRRKNSVTMLGGNRGQGFPREGWGWLSEEGTRSLLPDSRTFYKTGGRRHASWLEAMCPSLAGALWHGAACRRAVPSCVISVASPDVSLPWPLRSLGRSYRFSRFSSFGLRLSNDAEDAVVAGASC